MVTAARPWIAAVLVASVALAALGACGGDGAPDDGDDDAPDAAATPDAADGDPWQPAPAVIGGAIQETAAVALDGRIYVLGGFDGALGIQDDVRVFDTATGTWSQGAPLPQAVHHANAAVVGDTIYVVGALQSFQFTAAGVVWAWTPAVDDGWRELAPMPAGAERGSSVVGVIDGVIYLAGGLRGGAAVADVSSYDPAGGTWADLPDLPAARDHACGGVIDGALYVAGGRQADIESTAATTWSLAPGGGGGGGGWTDRAAMPTGRGGTACGVIDGRLIVVGGEGNVAVSSGVFPQTEAYDAAADAWTTLAPMRTPRHGMGAAAWGGTLYVPGGANVQAFGAVDTHETFTP